MLRCSCTESKKKKKKPQQKPKKQMFAGEECSQFTTELDAYVILLNTVDITGLKISKINTEATSWNAYHVL